MNNLNVRNQEITLHNENAVRVPVYRWDEGAVSYLSKREWVCVEAWVRSMSVSECMRELKEKVGSEWGWGKVASLLRRGRVRKVIEGKMKDRAMSEGLSRDGWIAKGMEYERGGGGANKMSWFYWKELGKAMGYYVEGDGPKVNMNFNLVQGDGKV